MTILYRQRGAEDLHWAELDCIVHRCGKKKRGVTTARSHQRVARVQQSSFSILLALGTTGFLYCGYSVLNTISVDRARFMFACGFTFCPFLLLSVSAWRKPAPEGCSRCLTIAPTGYHSSLRLYFSVAEFEKVANIAPTTAVHGRLL